MLREQTTGEEIANTVTHVIGSHLGAAMLALLVWAGVNSGVDVAWKVTSASIFGASVILLYAISSAYHAVQHPPAKRVLKVLDHMAIFFLIAGSYTPFCLVSLRPTNPVLAWSVFGVEWGMVLVGIVFKARTTGRFRYLSTAAYVAMGWVAVAAGRSDARNQYIFNIFALVKIGERSGHGLSNLFGVWKKSGYPEPMISESYDPDRTTIELKFEGVPTAGPDLTPNGAAGIVESRQELDNNQTISRQERLSDLSASVRRVFVELEHNPGFTQAGLVSKLGLPRATITTAIATLIKRGLLRRVGPKKGGHWEIVNPQPPTGGPGS